MIRTVKACACIAILMISVSLVRAAEPVDTAQSIIQDQIEAFLNDDAATAYSFASPQIKAKFPEYAIRLFDDDRDPLMSLGATAAMYSAMLT
jgi:hypothetical protein